MPVDVRLGDLAPLTACGDRGAVDEPIDPPERLLRLDDNILGLCDDGQISLNVQRLRALRLDGSCYLRECMRPAGSAGTAPLSTSTRGIQCA